MADYSFDESKMRLRLDCLGYLYGASVEDYEEAMARVIGALMEVRKVDTITLAKEREYEYDHGQSQMLLEIALALDGIIREGVISAESLGGEYCRFFLPTWNSKLQYIVFDRMRKDPIGAYVEILRELREANTKLRASPVQRARKCMSAYQTVLANLRQRMENTKLIQLASQHLAGYHVGDRALYRQFFMPVVRPNFMFTRYMVAPPEGGVSVDRYKVGEAQVEIFKIPNSTEFFYHAIPPEFKLSDAHYSLLDSARVYMATHQPKAAEFVKSENIREIFFNIGRDMVRGLASKKGAHMTEKDLDTLATILTRYTAGFGVLEVLLQDTRVQDIFINSPIERHPILVFHQDFEECRTNLIPTSEDAESWATRLRIKSGRPLDEANPVLDAELDVPGGQARIAVITRTLSPDGLGFAIRRHRDKPWTLPLFIKSKMLNPLAAGLLSFLIDGTVSLLVAGGRGAGKTSMLGSLMLEILPKTRVITIEDTLELPVNAMRDMDYNIERMKSRSVITRVETEMPADEALRTALRLGDSALIVGEIRSMEAKALYEAMRIGALSNVVAGTIHGESAYGVYDRVVNDLGVPPTSFKATDVIPICKTLRTADGLHRFRRMTEITEVRKAWDTKPDKEGGFVNLMEYSSKEDTLKPTDTLINGESEVLNRIASYVKEYAGDWNAVWENIKLRARIKQATVAISDKAGKPELLEADWSVKSNQAFHLLQESVRKEIGYPEPERVYLEWFNWFKGKAKLPQDIEGRLARVVA